MEANDQKRKVIRGVVSSMGPLQYKRDGTAHRVLTIKVPEARETRYVGAYLEGEDATDSVIRLGKSVVVSYLLTPARELVITDYYYTDSPPARDSPPALPDREGASAGRG